MTYRALARKAGYSASALSAAASGDTLPSLDVLLAYVGACDGDMVVWERRWHGLAAAQCQTEAVPLHDSAVDSGAEPPGRDPVSEWVPVIAAPYADELIAMAIRPESGGGGTSRSMWTAPAMEPLPLPVPESLQEPEPSARAEPPSEAGEPPFAVAESQPDAAGADAFPAGESPSAHIGRHRRRRRGNVHRRRMPIRPIQFGLAPIILATAAITVYSILLPASGSNTQILPPKTTPPVITLPTPSSTRTPQRVQPTASSSSTPTATVGAGSGGRTPPNTPSGTPPPSQSSLAMLGAPDWNGYCQANGHGNVQRTSNDAYGWHCADNSGIDGNAACAWTYGYSASKVIGRIQDFYDPFSWQCWRITRNLGAPDFGGYCQATKQGSVELVSDNAYGWHCSADNGTGDDANAVCSWTYGYSTSKLTNRFQNFNDPYSWQCLA
jgi:hypothetical protein